MSKYRVVVQFHCSLLFRGRRHCHSEAAGRRISRETGAKTRFFATLRMTTHALCCQSEPLPDIAIASKVTVAGLMPSPYFTPACTAGTNRAPARRPQRASATSQELPDYDGSVVHLLEPLLNRLADVVRCHTVAKGNSALVVVRRWT
jgi:hypothetical protein